MKKAKIIMTITISIVCFLLTMIIFMQFKVVQETQEADVDTMQEAELRQKLANWKTKYDETKEKYEETLATLNSYKEENLSDNKTKQNLEQELENLEKTLGKTDVEGEGIIITLTEKKQSELSEDEEITPIKAEDLIYIVNYLKDSGAEAISINDERIVYNTYIVDIGESIKINGKFVRANTYTIKAIGNSSYLESSIFGKGGYAEQLDLTGIKPEVQKQNKIQISKYNGEFETNGLENAKQGKEW